MTTKGTNYEQTGKRTRPRRENTKMDENECKKNKQIHTEEETITEEPTEIFKKSKHKTNFDQKKVVI